jgi:hypothetical protein
LGLPLKRTFAEHGSERKRKISTARCNLVRRARLNSGHPPIGVGRQAALGLVEDDQLVAEGIADARAATDRNVERGLDRLAARAQESRESLVNIFNDNIRFWADIQVNDELRVGVRKGE